MRNFWFESATPQFLLEELSKADRKEECKLLELDKIEGTEDLLQTFEIESLPLLSLLFQMDYLTIDTYNPISRNYILKYPNLEVRSSLNRHLVATITRKPMAKINPLIGILYQCILEEKVKEMIDCLRTILANIPYSLNKEEEKYYHSFLQVIFFATGIDAQSERFTSVGRMDLILNLTNVIYVIEVKVDRPPEEGLKQIESQKYYEPFLHTNKKVICLAISFIRKKSEEQEHNSFTITYAVKNSCFVPVYP